MVSSSPCCQRLLDAARDAARAPLLAELVDDVGELVLRRAARSARARSRRAWGPCACRAGLRCGSSCRAARSSSCSSSRRDRRPARRPRRCRARSSTRSTSAKSACTTRARSPNSAKLRARGRDRHRIAIERDDRAVGHASRIARECPPPPAVASTNTPPRVRLEQPHHLSSITGTCVNEGGTSSIRVAASSYSELLHPASESPLLASGVIACACSQSSFDQSSRVCPMPAHSASFRAARVRAACWRHEHASGAVELALDRRRHVQRSKAHHVRIEARQLRDSLARAPPTRASGRGAGTDRTAPA